MSRSSFADETRASLTAGLVCGAVDLAAAALSNPQIPLQSIFQSVASGWLGAEAYQGGWPSAWLGVVSHFGLMLGIAGAWMMLASLYPILRRQWITAGIVWGAVVWAVMTFAVVPLSASTLGAPDMAGALKGLAVHILAVGLPMAWIGRKMIENDPPDIPTDTPASV